MFEILIYVAVFLLAFVGLAVLLVRGWMLLPIEAIHSGWKRSYSKYDLSLILTLPLLIFEAGNLIGFSWKEFRILRSEEIIDIAIRYSYPNIYSNLAEMQKDYAKFTPEVRYWGSWSWDVDNGLFAKLVGLTRYQVRMPEEIVMVTVDGKAEFSRSEDCGDSGCPPIPPDIPEQGIVGTVQLGPPAYHPAEEFSVTWGGSEAGDIFKKGHCFSAHIKSAKPQYLQIKTASGKTREVRTGYGFYLVASMDDDSYSNVRISKSLFLKSLACDEKIRSTWPNAGGAAWIK